MKSKSFQPSTTTILLGALLSLPLLTSLPALAGDKDAKAVASPTITTETEKDLAGDVSRYFGQRANLYRDNNRKLAKIDLDGDFNYDGTINNDDPADNGAFQQTPPGLVLGVGEASRLVLRLTPYKIDYAGRAKVRLQVDGINRSDKSGEFAAGAVQSGMGHIIVWRDASKTEKILDSRDPKLCTHDWTLENRTPANLQIVPRTLYVEGVSPSPSYAGDIRLILSVYDDNPTPDNPGVTQVVDEKGVLKVYDKNPSANNVSNASSRTWLKSFRPSFDHILLTVRASPQEKNYVNNNVEGVWIPAKKELPIK